MEDVLLIAEQDFISTLLLGMAEENGWRVESARDGDQAELWMKRRMFQTAVLDLRLAEGRGESLLARLKQAWPLTQFVVIVPEMDAQRGLRALKLGAYDCATFPLESGLFEAAVRRACERSRLGADLRAARLRDEAKPVLSGGSAVMTRLREALGKAASHDAGVLFMGEPGTGKQLAARCMHHDSARRKGPFVAFDCVENPSVRGLELFGRAMEPGALELASSGTLLLRHAEFLPPPEQAKLLRALQDRGFTPKASTRFVPLDARVCATASPSLRENMKVGSFREDLFWSLGATPIELPALRNRREDIEELLAGMLAVRCARLGRPLPAMRPETLQALKQYAFPGNVSQLEALAELVVSLDHDDVGLADLPVSVFVGDHGDDQESSLKALVHAFERQIILHTLKAVRGNQSRAAARLRVHRNTLILKMLELDIPNKRAQKKIRFGKQ